MPWTIRNPISQSAPARPVHPVDREQQGRDRVDDEPERVHANAAVHVAEPAEADDEHARDDQEPEDHPEQVEAVARLERIEVDARKIAGIATRTIDASIVASITPSVVFESATHLYRSSQRRLQNQQAS